MTEEELAVGDWLDPMNTHGFRFVVTQVQARNVGPDGVVRYIIEVRVA